MLTSNKEEAMKDFPLKSLLKKFKESGFTMIEMAVVLVVIGIVVSIMVTSLPLLLQSAKLRQAKAEVEKIDFSLEGYLISKGRFPCPDTTGDGLENRIPGPNPPLDDTCGPSGGPITYVGALPYLTLGLSSGKDPWQNVMGYGVYEDLIKSTGGSDSTSFCNVIKSVPPTPQPPATPTKIYTTITTGGVDTNTYQAYIIVSGGSKDADNVGVGGFFDGLNGDGTLLQFEDGGKITLATYDDIVRAASFPYLAGKECVGTPAGGVLGGTGENTYPNGCINGLDDDYVVGRPLDGIDCADSDCATDYACTSSAQVTIIAATLPSGYINDAYTVDIEATGGTAPYTWELLDKGGFADFVINPYTGVVSGTLNQCPGTYTIQVKVTDSVIPPVTPTSFDTKSFSITVDKAITINGRSAITWSDPEWQEPYNLTGVYFGTPIGWTLAPTGLGFTAASTGADSCVIKKTGDTTAGDYTFILTATDPACSATNKVDKAIAVTVTAAGAPAPLGADATAFWKFDECSWNGTTAEVRDSSPNILDGTALPLPAGSGPVTVAGGKICRGGRFDGVNDQVSVPNNALLQFTTTFSIGFWLRLPDGGFQGRLVGKGPTDSNNTDYELELQGGKVRFRIANQRLNSATAVDDLAWHYIVATYDKSLGSANMKIYIDGALDSTRNTTITPPVSTDPLQIGSSTDGKIFNIDEVIIYNNKALSSTEITKLYNAGVTPTRTCTTCP